MHSRTVEADVYAWLIDCGELLRSDLAAKSCSILDSERTRSLQADVLGSILTDSQSEISRACLMRDSSALQ